MESGVKALCITINSIQDASLGLDILKILIKVDHILENVLESRNIEEVWWIKN